jgi:UDP-N-acetylglucosamine 2-epimerase (non-hydrolysing)
MAPLYRSLTACGALDVKLISTGQHREMSQQAFEAFELQPDIELDLMTHSQSLGEFSSKAISALTGCFVDQDPDIVLVHGDTTTTLAASLAAFYLKKKVGHVEAGMRTGDMLNPWPEEMNRRLTAPLCHWHFVPVARNLQNLICEGIPSQRCFVTGNTAIDALFWMQEKLQSQPCNLEEVRSRLNVSQQFFQTYLVDRSSPLILVTGHRREAHGEGIQSLCQAILELLNCYPNLGVLYPVHLNPQIKDVVHLRLNGHTRVALTAPLDYRDFVWVMQQCFAIVSDSGGIQCEAMSLHKPLLVTRETTEYPEAVDCGGCQLVGLQPERIVQAVTLLLTDNREYIRRSQVKNPYGDGHAANKIVEILTSDI